MAREPVVKFSSMGIFLLAFVAWLQTLSDDSKFGIGRHVNLQRLSPCITNRDLRRLEYRWDQLIIFVVTITVTLATDLLVGIFAGVAVQFILHFFFGCKISNFVQIEF
jgi:hypothetical protein